MQIFYGEKSLGVQPQIMPEKLKIRLRKRIPWMYITSLFYVAWN